MRGSIQHQRHMRCSTGSRQMRRGRRKHAQLHNGVQWYVQIHGGVYKFAQLHNGTLRYGGLWMGYAICGICDRAALYYTILSKGMILYHGMTVYVCVNIELDMLWYSTRYCEICLV